MGNLQFVGHQLVQVLAVGQTDIFFETETMEDGQDSVDSIHGKEDDIAEVMGGYQQPAQQEYQNEGYTDGTDVAGETAGLGTEVVQVENQDGQYEGIQQRGGYERNPVMVDPCQ